MDPLIEELKAKLIATVNLADRKPDDIRPDDPLIGQGLGLDSIDVLEIVVMLEQDYGVKIDNKELGQQAFASLRALADFVRKNRPAAAP
jgi:acyl carrier protein